MALRIGDRAPDFTASTTIGTISFHDWIGDSWCVLFSHPKDFTPVCLTELGQMAIRKGDFEARHCKIIGLSADPVARHLAWADDVKDVCGTPLSYPLIGDPDLDIAKAYGMLPASASAAGPRTAMDNATVRNVFIIAPDKTIRLILAYPMTTGRSVDEILRVLDSVQLTAEHKLATPANWQPGEEAVIVTSLSDEDARQAFPNGWRAPKPYLRFVEHPK
ncbi:MAG: peroxiredoxin [Devosia sp.]